MQKLAAKKRRDAQVGKYEKLLSIYKEYGDLPEYFQEMIILAGSLNLQEKVAALQVECTAKYAGDGVNCGGNSQFEAGNSGILGFLKAL